MRPPISCLLSRAASFRKHHGPELVRRLPARAASDGTPCKTPITQQVRRVPHQFGEDHAASNCFSNTVLCDRVHSHSADFQRGNQAQL